MSPYIDLDLGTKTCSTSKCYSDLCAPDKARGAVGQAASCLKFERRRLKGLAASC
ncbi:hypothetical protein ABIA22_002816 [Sinorhizobium fredii]